MHRSTKISNCKRCNEVAFKGTLKSRISIALFSKSKNSLRGWHFTIPYGIISAKTEGLGISLTPVGGVQFLLESTVNDDAN